MATYMISQFPAGAADAGRTNNAGTHLLVDQAVPLSDDQLSRLAVELTGGGWTETQTARAMAMHAELREGRFSLRTSGGNRMGTVQVTGPQLQEDQP